MPSCKEITELAAAHAEGTLAGEAKAEFESHVAGCSGCRTWLRQLSTTTAAVRALPPPALHGELQDQLLRRFDRWQAGRALEPTSATPPSPAGGRFAWEALLVIAGLVALLVGMARNPSRARADWVVSLGLAAAAMALALVARRLTPRFAVAAVSAALVAAAIRGGPGQLDLTEGMECLAVEVVGAGVVAGSAWLAAKLRKGVVALGPWAVAGSLAGAAALQVACSGHASLPHLLVLHAGGVLLVAAAALAWPLRRPLAT